MSVRRGALLAAVLLSVGCDSSHEPAPTLISVTPSRSYNDLPLTVTLTGGHFRPSFALDTGTGTAAVDTFPFAGFLSPAVDQPGTVRAAVGGFKWLDASRLQAQIPRLVPLGTYDFQVRDPRGVVAKLPAAFTSLGPDLDGPVVKLLEPEQEALIVEHSDILVRLQADDGSGHLRRIRWTLTSPTLGTRSDVCSYPEGPSTGGCQFRFSVPHAPTLVEVADLHVEAEDSANQVTVLNTLFRMVWKPVVTSLVPLAGPTTGMTQIVVRGQNFVLLGDKVTDGTRIMVGGIPILPGGGVVENEGTIRGITPPHDPGSAEITVVTGNGAVSMGTFEYVSVPKVRLVDPPFGSENGGTVVILGGNDFRKDGTMFFVGAGLVRDPMVSTEIVSPNRARVVMPPGRGVVSIFAVDPIAGEGEMRNGYTFLAQVPPL